jgi:pilus assembly protein CpaE
MIVAARNHTVEGVRQLFRQGATDVLPTPLLAADLRAAVADALGQSGGDEAPVGEVIAVMSAVGGAGATTVAANLAGALALGKSRKKEGANGGSAALLDFDLQFGDAALALDLQPRTCLIDVLKSPERLDAAFFDGVAVRHATGLKLLAAPPEIVPLDAMDAAAATSLVATAARAHEATVIDLPRAWTDWTAPVLNACDLVILVTDPSVAGVAGARRVLDAFASLEVKKPEVMLVINHVAGPIEALDRIGRVRDALGRPVDAQLREDASAARSASDAGRLPVDAEARSKLGKDLIALTDAVRERAAGHVKARRAARG